LCTAQSTFAAISEWLRHEKSQPQVFFESQATRTTRLRPLAALGSRRSYTNTKRSDVAPFIGIVNRELVVRGVCGINLTRTVTSDERAEGLIEQRGVICAGAQAPSFV
jgi:hypothetical protein